MALVVILLLAAAAALWWLFAEKGAEEGVIGFSSTGKDAAREEPVIGELDSDSSVEEGTERVQLPADVSTRTESGPPEKDGIRLEGSITVVDGAGISHGEESGSFSLIVWKGGRGMSDEVAVEEGRWSVLLDSDLLKECDAGDLHLNVMDLELGGRSAVVENKDERIPFPETAFLPLRARWLSATTLLVKSAVSGKHLDGIEMVTGIGWPASDCVHPGNYGEKNVFHRAAASPIEIDPSTQDNFEFGTKVFFCRSPRHAWGRIEIDLSSGNERLLLLHPGGGLDVVLTGPEPPRQARLRMRRFEDPEPIDPSNEGSADAPPGEKEKVDYQPTLDLELGRRSRITADSLPAGRYRVTVEIGDYWSTPLCLGEGTVRIESAQRAYLTLPLTDAPRHRTVPLEGQLMVPAEWGFESMTLNVKLLGNPLPGNRDEIYIRKRDLDPVPGREGLYNWSAGSVQPGRYTLILNPPEYGVTVLVGEAGLKDAYIEVPLPARVSVRVIDAFDRTDVALDEISWHPKRPPGVTGGGLESAAKNTQSNRFEFLAPQGEIEIAIWSDKHTSRHRSFTVLPGFNEFEIELELACGFVLLVKDGEIDMPLNSDWYVKATEVDGKGSTRSYSYGEGGVRIGVSNPGTYRFEFPTPEEFKPLPVQEVVVEPGKFVERVIRLERKF